MRPGFDDPINRVTTNEFVVAAFMRPGFNDPINRVTTNKY